MCCLPFVRGFVDKCVISYVASARVLCLVCGTGFVEGEGDIFLFVFWFIVFFVAG